MTVTSEGNATATRTVRMPFADRMLQVIVAIRVLTARRRTHFTTAEIAAEIDERMGPWNVRRHVDALEGAGYLVNTTPERARNHRYQVAPRIMEEVPATKSLRLTDSLGDHVLASGESWLDWMERVLSGPTVPRERLAERLYELGVEVAHRRREHAAEEPGVDPAPQPTLLSMYDAAVRAAEARRPWWRRLFPAASQVMILRLARIEAKLDHLIAMWEPGS